MNAVNENVVTITPNGPVLAQGRVRVVRSDGSVVVEDTQVALCRCGASKNKPLCDGSHKSCGFQDTGTLAQELAADKDADVQAGALEIAVAPNGPLLLRGSCRIVDGTGSARGVVRKGALCRCGASATKPFCDGTHGKVGFTG